MVEVWSAKHIISIKQLEMLETIGQGMYSIVICIIMCFCITVLLNIGEFGIVFRGLLTINEDDIAQPVAVKTLKGIVINVTYTVISL